MVEGTREAFPKTRRSFAKGGKLQRRSMCWGYSRKAKVSQSTVSSYLNMMQKAGLLESIRHGQWTYYRRNEEFIQQVAKYFKTEI